MNEGDLFEWCVVGIPTVVIAGGVIAADEPWPDWTGMVHSLTRIGVALLLVLVAAIIGLLVARRRS